MVSFGTGMQWSTRVEDACAFYVGTHFLGWFYWKEPFSNWINCKTRVFSTIYLFYFHGNEMVGLSTIRCMYRPWNDPSPEMIPNWTRNDPEVKLGMTWPLLDPGWTLNFFSHVYFKDNNKNSYKNNNNNNNNNNLYCTNSLIYICSSVHYNSRENEVKDINKLHDNKTHINETFKN